MAYVDVMVFKKCGNDWHNADALFLKFLAKMFMGHKLKVAMTDLISTYYSMYDCIIMSNFLLIIALLF